MEYMSSLQNDLDDLKPSLFELLSEQQLSSLLPPSLRYLLAVATHRHPRYLLRALNSFDELYALLSLLVERYYLKTFGGSFTENFYSLKRERVLLVKNGEIPRAQLGAAGSVRETLKLRESDVWRNLAVLVGLPYLKRKLDESYDVHAAPYLALVRAGGGGGLDGAGGGPRYQPGEDLPPNPTLRQRLMHYYKWFLRNVYPSINAAYYFSILAFNLAYLFDNTKYSSPFLWLIGTRIRRLGAADHRAIAMATQPKASGSGQGVGRPPHGSSRGSWFPVQTLYPQLLSSLRILLPTSIFALKFLEWWHASDFSRQLTKKATEALDLPAPVVSGLAKRTQELTSTRLGGDVTKTTAEKEISRSSSDAKDDASNRKRPKAPMSSTSFLPIFTVPLPAPESGSTCPICLNTLTNPTACQTGYVFCYGCIFRWLNGEQERQVEFMNGDGAGAAWEDDAYDVDEGEKGNGRHGPHGDDNAGPEAEKEKDENRVTSRHGRWESGVGRCPITGRRVLGGAEGLRKVLV